MENDQRSSGVRGVGPAESTGKSVVRYWPGGIRDATSDCPAPCCAAPTDEPARDEPLGHRCLLRDLQRTSSA